MQDSPGPPAATESTPADAAEAAQQAAMARTCMFRGYMLRELGQPNQAADAFRQGMDLCADSGLNAYFLASMGRHPTPAAPPRAYVERLFDDYAPHFDTHLVGLGYRVPRLLGQRIHAASERFESALDMGCGTGLCGPMMKAVAKRMDGVDLSAAMIEKARALGAYDRLEHADLVDYLQRTDRRYDLAVCADVFGYIGALDDLFGGVARVLMPGGIFCFSAEKADDAVDFELRPSLRYAQSTRYIRALAQRWGFELEHMQEEGLREERKVTVTGVCVWLRKGGTHSPPS